MLSINQVLNNRYHIEEVLSQNEAGGIYRAMDMSLNLKVAIKENLDTSPEARRQFKVEAAILTRLSHPNLPKVTDYFFIPRQGHYLAMHFIEGDTLKERLVHGALPEAEVLLWATQICNALAYLHNQDEPIVHAAISPSNIKVLPDGRAILVGMGISKIYSRELRANWGMKIAKAGYTPLEQYHGVADALSDIYALGATLYHLLTAELPLDALSRSRDDAPLKLPRQFSKQINPEVEHAIIKAIEPARERRYQDANQFRAALARSIEGASAYNDVLYVFPSSTWTFITGLMVLSLFACTILSVTSFVRDNDFGAVGAALRPRPTMTVTPTATVGSTPTPLPLTPSAWQSFKSVPLGISFDYPKGWRRREEALRVIFSPAVDGLDPDNLRAMSIWMGISTADPPDSSAIINAALANFAHNANVVTKEEMSVASQKWYVAQITFSDERLGGSSIAIAAATQSNEVGYFIVAVAPATQWPTMQPIFEQVMNSFQFTKEVVVRFLNEDELPPTPTATATPIIYIVQPGDSFGRIAGMYGIKMQTLIDENNLKLNAILRVGQELVIPVGYDE